VDHPAFSTPGEVNAALQDAVALLRVPRSSLGITCASKGAVVGKVGQGVVLISCPAQQPQLDLRC
jgi:hypothetical protein